MTINQEQFSATAPWRVEYPFASHWEELPGNVRLHYVDEPGGGTPVVMVHGNPTWSFHFRHVIQALRGDRRCIAPDHIGCGLSDKPQDYEYRLARHVANLEELLIGRLKLKRFSLLLHDWGGAIGMGVAVRHPECVEKIALLNTAAFLDSFCPLRIRVCRIPGFGALAIRGFNAFALGAVHMAAVRPGSLTAAARAGYLAPYGNWRDRIATHRFVEDIPLAPRHPTWDVVRGIEQQLPLLAGKPLRILWGGRDFCFDDRFLRRWRQIFPQARVTRFADAGHYLLEDARAEVVPLLREFFAEG